MERGLPPGVPARFLPSGGLRVRSEGQLCPVTASECGEHALSRSHGDRKEQVLRSTLSGNVNFEGLGEAVCPDGSRSDHRVCPQPQLARGHTPSGSAHTLGVQTGVSKGGHTHMLVPLWQNLGAANRLRVKVPGRREGRACQSEPHASGGLGASPQNPAVPATQARAEEPAPPVPSHHVPHILPQRPRGWSSPAGLLLCGSSRYRRLLPLGPGITRQILPSAFCPMDGSLNT